uniref:Uncharacterized protein n=1 Tax=Rhizophora mucronata TaxID=61149 RepID=A0A2P2QI99_RHIMU
MPMEASHSKNKKTLLYFIVRPDLVFHKMKVI